MWFNYFKPGQYKILYLVVTQNKNLSITGPIHLKLWLVGLGLILYFPVRAQVCTQVGQTPETAILICGSDAFNLQIPEFCGQTEVPVPCPAGFPYQNINPHLFRMNCFSSGTLGFIIVPDQPTVNFDWQLFDVTSSNPADIYTNPARFVACNWSSEPGETGATIDGTDLVVCGGPGGSRYSKMPDIVAGKTYILLITSPNSSLHGYQLTLTGGSASVTDPVEPHLFSAYTNCASTKISVRLNKKILCESISSDGSDFTISNGATITGAGAVDCTNLLGTDSIFLTLSQPLPYGNYTLTIRNGIDGNTLMDICQRKVPEGESVPLVSAPPQPITMDSLEKPGCAPAYVELVFRRPVDCFSIAPDGSDFIITGPQPVGFGVDTRDCNRATETRRIRLLFSSPITTIGDYRLSLVTGSDGNSLIDECGLSVLAPTPLSFRVEDPIIAGFTINAPPSCAETTVSFFHDGNGSASRWNWDFGDGTTATSQSPQHVYTAPGRYTVKLTVSNARCTDSSTQQLTIRGFMKASFDAPAIVCPGDTIRLTNTSTGTFDTWHWDFGNGQNSGQQDPGLIRYPSFPREMYYTVSLTATSVTPDCLETAKKVIRVPVSCLIGVPSAFSPNGDGLNDFLYPLNAFNAEDLQFRVYNRTGQLVFESRNWSSKWDGRIKGVPQDTGVFAWFLSYRLRGSRETTVMKGTTLLLR